MDELKNIRRDYTKKSLTKAEAGPDPFLLFTKWMKEAIAAGVDEPNAMVLSSIGLKKMPSSRIVLLKEITDKGFVFFTNYLSKKGKELATSPNASLLFFWPKEERQIRIEGFVSKITEEDNKKYFSLRPRESQIGAHASEQSNKIDKREELEHKFEIAKKEFLHKEIPKPAQWGGYKLQPCYFEFWQGGAHRLHDRISFTKTKNNWAIDRLSP